MDGSSLTSWQSWKKQDETENVFHNVINMVVFLPRTRFSASGYSWKCFENNNKEKDDNIGLLCLGSTGYNLVYSEKNLSSGCAKNYE